MDFLLSSTGNGEYPVYTVEQRLAVFISSSQGFREFLGEKSHRPAGGGKGSQKDSQDPEYTPVTSDFELSLRLNQDTWPDLGSKN